MTGEGRRTTTTEELATAREELGIAEELLAAGHSRVAITRLYFALFHAVRALLYSHGHEPRSHGGVKTLFGRHFVKEGDFTAADARLLTRLHGYRQEADYSVAIAFDEAAAREELDAVRDLLGRIEEAVAEKD